MRTDVFFHTHQRVRRVAALRFVVLLLLLPAVLASCNRDHLYYEITNQPNVQLNIDWSQTAFSPTHPAYDPENALNGVTIFAFDAATRELVAEFPPDANWRKPKLKLAPGNYELVLINDSRGELPSIRFNVDRTFDEFDACVITDAPGLINTSSLTAAPDTVYSYMPEYLTSAAVREVCVQPVQNEYEYDRPDASNTHVTVQEIDVVERSVTKRINIKVNVKGINYCKAMQPSFMSGLSASANLVTRQPEKRQVVYAFNLNNRQFRNDAHTEATLSQSFNSFGFSEENMHEGTRFLITLNFLLVNNQTYTASVDVTPQLEQWLEEHTIDCDLDLDIDIAFDVTLPEAYPEDPDTPQEGGGFNPETSPWNDIEQDIVM